MNVMCCALCVVLLGSIASSALAERTSADQAGFQAVLLPVTLSGSTEDAGEAKVGAGVAWGLGERLDLAASLNASVATNSGFANLFSAKSGDSGIQQSTPWEVGLSVALAGLTPPSELRSDLPESVQRQMFAVCNVRCEGGADDDFCKGRPTELQQRARGWTKSAFETLPAAQFCEARRAAVVDADTPLTVPEGGPAATPAALDAKKRARSKARQSALEQCAADCVSVESDPIFCTSPAMTQARGSLYQSYDANNICPEGKARYD